MANGYVGEVRAAGGVDRELEGEDYDLGHLTACCVVLRLEARAACCAGRVGVVAVDYTVAVEVFDIAVEPVVGVNVCEVHDADC